MEPDSPDWLSGRRGADNEPMSGSQQHAGRSHIIDKQEREDKCKLDRHPQFDSIGIATLQQCEQASDDSSKRQEEFEDRPVRAFDARVASMPARSLPELRGDRHTEYPRRAELARMKLVAGCQAAKAHTGCLGEARGPAMPEPYRQTANRAPGSRGGQCLSPQGRRRKTVRIPPRRSIQTNVGADKWAVLGGNRHLANAF